MDAFVASPLCPSPIELRLDEIAFETPELVVKASARRRVVACPVCGHASTRVHSRYHRTLADLPWHGLRVRLKVRVRRYFCDVPGCSRKIFTERLPKTATPYARRTARAASAIEAIALALGGRAGARLALVLGFATRPAALLAARAPIAEQTGASHDPTPDTTTRPTRVLGVDDWAWRKGHRYGTILVDLERHRVIDLLPDREPATLAAWLEAHPGVEFISRDRAGGYAEGALLGAPEAIQVADRFHLLRNLTDAVERVVERHHRAVHGIGLEPRRTSVPKRVPTDGPSPRPPKRGGPVSRPIGAPRIAEQRKLARRERRGARYAEVVALGASGVSIAEIHRRVGLSRATVMRWLSAGTFPERRPTRWRPTLLTPHADYLRARWEAGCHNATQLWRLLREERGFRGGRSTVRDWVLTHLRSAATREPATERAAAPSTPSTRRTAWLLTASAARLNEAERCYIDAVCAASPALVTAHALAMEFRRMLEAHDSGALAPWLIMAEASELRSLAAGLRRDRDAVLAAILFPWSNGQVEGQVNRLKLIKRMMYGRASLQLLRRRVLAA